LIVGSEASLQVLLEDPQYLGNLELASEFLDYVDQRAGLLVGRGGAADQSTSYSFPHRTFQEYLAGCYIIGLREAGRELFHRASEGDHWSLAAQLGAEELYFNRHNPNLLLDLAYWLNCEPSDPQQQRAVLWLGNIATVLGQEIIQRDADVPDGGARYLERLKPGLLTLLGGALSPPERDEAGSILARLGDPRFDPQMWHLPKESLLGFIEIPPGDFLMGSNPRKDKRAYDDEKPQHWLNLPGYYLTRDPVTVAQFQAFVAESGHKPRDPESLESLSNHPVVNVNWYDALAYCRWLEEKLKGEAQKRVREGRGESLLARTSQGRFESDTTERSGVGEGFPWDGWANLSLG